MEYWYNTTYHVSINTTPFNIVYGMAALPLISYGENKVSNDTVEQQLMVRDIALVALKEHLTLAQNCMKKFYDQKRREVEFEVGSEVSLKLRPYRQRTLAKKRCERLSPKFYGPYLVIERIGQVAY